VLLLGLGTTAGVVAMALVLVPAVLRMGTDLRWLWAPRHPAVRKLARLSGWTVGYVAANQVAFFVVLVLGYRATGDVSVYLAAFTFFQLPHGLLAVSVITALGPELASHHQRGDIDGLRRQFARGMRLILLTMIPAAVGLVIVAEPTIRALLDHGDFTARSVSATSDTLRAFAVGLVAFSVYLYIVRVFSSIQDTRTPFLLNVFENGVNIATAFAFYEWRGVEGLAWSWSVAYSAAAVAALVVLRARLHRLEGRSLLDATARIVVAVVPAALAVAAIEAVVGTATPTSAAVTLVLGGIAGVALYVGTLQLLGIRLIGMIMDILRPSRRAPAAGA
jgi:putative peptidoglycan lipid II flippase